MTRQNVLNWQIGTWGSSDIAFLSHILDLLPADCVEYFQDRSRPRVVVTVAGERAVVIEPGFVYWPFGTWATSVDVNLIPGPDGLQNGKDVSLPGAGTVWARLSNFLEGDRGGTPRSRSSVQLCQSHNLEMNALGVCDYC